ncbi:MAG: hypothetical protein ACO3SO_05640 [Luteolibacter sp.]
MALQIAQEEPDPTPQEGQVVVFKRRNPEQSIITSELDSLEALHNHIRMLDCDGYPHAYLDLGNFRLTFRRSSLHQDQLEAEVTIRPQTAEHPSNP